MAQQRDSSGRFVKGGAAAKQFILQAKRAQRGAVDELQVGFFATAKYPDGTPVTNVAVWNEFGTGSIPERPFFRQALAGAKRSIGPMIRASLDGRKMAMDRQAAGRVGRLHAGPHPKPASPRYAAPATHRAPSRRKGARIRSRTPSPCGTRSPGSSTEAPLRTIQDTEPHGSDVGLVDLEDTCCRGLGMVAVAIQCYLHLGSVVASFTKYIDLGCAEPRDDIHGHHTKRIVLSPENPSTRAEVLRYLS